MKLIVQGAPAYGDGELVVFRGIINARIDEVNNSLKTVALLPASDEHKQRIVYFGEASIKELKMALKRVDNGTYGICRATGKLISIDVLLEKPETSINP